MALFDTIARTRDRLRRRFGGLMPKVQVERAFELLGSAYGGYAVCPAAIDAGSVVYSFGIGEDVSWDRALIDRFGVKLHAFDPTPRSLAWLAEQDLPASFEVHPWGLAAHDGVATFTPPENPEHISHTLLERERFAGARIEVEVFRLATVLERLGHARVDILKMDIEGAEYAAIDDILASGIEVKQLLVEYHHHLEGVMLAETEGSIARLNAAGYRIFHVSPSGHELSFIACE
jgi:FkbM family methyltransferase